ncbi:MAG TPA: DNA replication and repair protein RecF [Gemmatimonadales bacterium]|nr:DNA replication and repair protein RecF [Gemmatimonadales bacterium]
MRAAALLVRGFRNLADTALEFPPGAVVLLGPNGHGKTNLLEAVAYPVLFRSLLGSRDRDVARHGGPGFHVLLTRDDGVAIGATWDAVTGKKRVTVDDIDHPRITDAIGAWLAVAFLPSDLALVQGGAAERRRWIDRMLSLAHPSYLSVLLHYRAALAQRGAALRRGDVRLATAFDQALGQAGAAVMTTRLEWMTHAETALREELAALGEPLEVTLRYRGDAALSDPDTWRERLRESIDRDLRRGQTHVGPHRDELSIGLAGHGLREFGSTGQQRTAAIALRLLEHATLATRIGAPPALLVDDIFAELDGERQERLAARLQRLDAQLMVTAPRAEDVPSLLEAPRWHVTDGRIQPA